MASKSSTAQPGGDASMVNKEEKTLHGGASPADDGRSLAGSLKGDVEKQTTESEAEGSKEADDATTYPPTREVLPIMLALYLVMFLTALVCS